MISTSVINSQIINSKLKHNAIVSSFCLNQSELNTQIHASTLTANAVSNDSISNDLSIRNNQKILFSSNSKKAAHLSLSTPSFAVNTTNFKISTAKNQSIVLQLISSLSGNTYELTWSNGLLTELALV